MRFELHCAHCHKGPVANGAYQCPACGRTLEATYPDLVGSMKAAFNSKDTSLPGIWRYRDLLPVNENTPVVSLGEGDTPLQECDRLQQKVGVSRLLIKNETMNPSGTFKDRCMAIGVAKALEFGASAAVLASAGNAGASAAAYAARAGLPLFVFIPKHTPRERITQILLYGARAIATGGSVNEAIDLINKVRGNYGWHVLTTAALLNPYQAEGPKTIGYEMAAQMEFAVPDWIIVPIGGGGILSAIWKAYTEMQAAGFVAKLPRMVGVQASGCAPLIRAFDEGLPADAIPTWGSIATIAASIADPFPVDGEAALTSIRKSGGRAVAVEDEEILAAEAMLAASEGIFAEPGSSSTLAALLKLQAQGVVDPDSNVVLVVTGTGFKDMKSAERVALPPIEMECTVEALQEAIGKGVAEHDYA